MSGVALKLPGASGEETGEVRPLSANRLCVACNNQVERKGNLMNQGHVSGDETRIAQWHLGALLEMQAAVFDTLRSANRCWLAIAQAQATAGLDVVARITSATSGQRLRSEMNEDDLASMDPSEEVKLLHILE